MMTTSHISLWSRIFLSRENFCPGNTKKAGSNTATSISPAGLLPTGCFY